VTIRRAGLADADRLSEFARRSFRETFAASNTPEDMDAYLSSAFTPARQRAEIEDARSITLLVERPDALIGYAHLHAGEPPDCVSDRSAIELVRFYVDRALHGSGVARTLMNAVDAAAAARARTIWLGVWEHNPRAIAFYLKCGFVDVGRHPFQLGRDVQTDRIMSRDVMKA
jgi:GNAT superfamily N-acetyltransferase